MSKKTEQTTTRQFDPQSMASFNLLNPAAAKVIAEYMKDPFQSSFFSQRQQMIQKQNAGAEQAAWNNLMARSSTFGSIPGFVQGQIAANQRASTARLSNAFLQNLMQTEEMRRWAAQAGISYQPLETGQSSTTKQSGLGTWLPQVLGTAAGIGIGAATGGLSFGAKAATSAASAGKGFMNTALTSGNFFGPSNPFMLGGKL